MKNWLIISTNAVQELFFDRALYLLGCFVGLALGLAVILGQMTYGEQVKLTLDFLLSAAQIALLLFSVFMGISLFHREMALGSISMVLSKPISRVSFLTGKFTGQMVIQCLLTVGMGAVIWLACYRLGGIPSGKALIQGIVLSLVESSVLASITYFFAVNSGAVVTSVAAMSFFCIGHLQRTIDQNIGKSAAAWIWNAAQSVIPNLEVFNMKALVAYGQPLTWTAFAWACMYGACTILIYLAAASVLFQRKDIAT